MNTWSRADVSTLMRSPHAFLVLVLLSCVAHARPDAPDTLPAASPAPLSGLSGLAPVAGNASLLGLAVPPLLPELLASVQRWNNARAANLFDLEPDGSGVLLGTRFGSTQQLHFAGQPLGARTQLTFGQEPVLSARFQPGDSNILYFLQDSGGGEFYQLYRFDRRTLQSELLTDGKSRHDALVVSREGRRLAWSGTGRNGRDSDVYFAAAASPKEQKRLTEEDGTWRPLDFSPAGTKLLLVHERSAQDADLWIYDVEKNEKRQLTPKDAKASVRTAAFTADGRGVYVVTDRWSAFNEVYRLDPTKPEEKPAALTRSIPWDVEAIAVPHDPGAPASLAIAVNQDGYSRLYLAEPGTGALTSIALPGTVLTGLSFAGKRPDHLALTVESARSARDVFVLDVRTRKFTRWTQSELGPLRPADLVEPELVRIPSVGGIVVPGFVFRPKAGEAGARHAALVLWHGGPEGQHRPGFSAFVQMLVQELGLTVVLPNPRGSDGYGKLFLSADDGIKREEALADLGAVLDWTAQRPEVDPARVGVYGGSYGGYLALASLAFFPEKVRAAVDVVGVSNLATFLESTQAYRRDLRRAEYGDERDPVQRVVLERISPLNAVERMRGALFVLQGKNDPRVPQGEAEQMVKALRALGRDPWYILALNEGHGFKRKENTDVSLAATLLFLRERLVK